MRYHNITHDDMLNGPGLRVVAWLAGCEHHCSGCQNPCTWDPEGGLPFTEWEEAEVWEWLLKPWTQGITFSGGDPLHPANRQKVGQLSQTIKGKYPEKDICVYTGYELVIEENEFFFEDKEKNRFTLPWLKYIDILVDGRYEADIRKKDIEEHKKVLYRGSSNQKLIDIQKSIAENRICLLYDEQEQ